MGGGGALKEGALGGGRHLPRPLCASWWDEPNPSWGRHLWAQDSRATGGGVDAHGGRGGPGSVSTRGDSPPRNEGFTLWPQTIRNLADLTKGGWEDQEMEEGSGWRRAPHPLLPPRGRWCDKQAADMGVSLANTCKGGRRTAALWTSPASVPATSLDWPAPPTRAFSQSEETPAAVLSPHPHRGSPDRAEASASHVSSALVWDTPHTNACLLKLHTGP